MASGEFHDLIVATLKADAEVSAIVGGRVYDEPPTAATFPYVSLGASDYTPDDDECITSGLEAMDIHCWVREHGRTRPARVLTRAVTRALHRAGLSLTDNALVYLEVRGERVMDDPDGITAHGVVTIEAMTEEPA